MKILFFDTETTGVDAAKNCIHQLAGLLVVDGEVKERFSFNICPDDVCIIEDAALQVAGVSRVQIASYAPGGEVLGQLLAILNKHVDRYNKADKIYLAGYNSRAFDEPFLRNFFTKNGNNYFGSYFWQIGFDVMVLAAQHLSDRLPYMPNFRLATVAAELGVSVDGQLHNAMYDAELTYAIYQRLKKPVDALPLARKVLDTLDQQQRFFIAARTGGVGKAEALELSKQMEKELRNLCAEIIKPNVSQQMIF